MNELILYTTEDGRSQISLRADRQTVWLTQLEMAELFDVSVDNIGLHLRNIYQDGELIREATTEESSVVQIEGTRKVQRSVTLCNVGAGCTCPGLTHLKPAEIGQEERTIDRDSRIDRIQIFNRQ